MTSVAVHVVSLRDLDRVRGDAEPALPAADRAAIARRTHGRRRVQAQAARVLATAVAAPGSVNASHDQDFLVLAQSPVACGVDVEDAAEDELLEVADRFCAEGELRERIPARGLWAAKESAAKACGRGLRAGLRTIRFDGDPTATWSAVDWPFGSGFLTRVLDLGDRHCALTVRAATPPRVRTRVWTPTASGGRWTFVPATRPAGDPAHEVAAALSAFGGGRG
ncbi:4'-phosphopantetheinyl transferase superfamily protein [Actinokineospora terrae]|uniref:4'-phosphopantetheinyl transferase superfamily protein n=1 Tax=Actinokineospora terrae TaxID=155974 RepID=A0A1H9XT95_9PSEU|nr:4'-phosphopantetheinyl transferase superfamily protein [Actinokineospora terrae]